MAESDKNEVLDAMSPVAIEAMNTARSESLEHHLAALPRLIDRMGGILGLGFPPAVLRRLDWPNDAEETTYDMLRHIRDNATLVVHFPGARLESMLNSGFYKNQFETLTSFLGTRCLGYRCLSFLRDKGSRVDWRMKVFQDAPEPAVASTLHRVGLQNTRVLVPCSCCPRVRLVHKGSLIRYKDFPLQQDF